MKLGYRVTDKADVGRYPADLVQVSAFYGWPRAVEKMLECVETCRAHEMPYVVHPVDYRISDPRPFVRPRIMEDVRLMAQNAGLALIIHDEVDTEGSRLAGEFDAAYREALTEFSGLCPVSIENANSSVDIKWFWKSYPRPSITLDIGHLETEGIDSALFVDGLEEELLARLTFVHLHRTNGLRKGLRDHWGLTEGCRELEALRRLLRRKAEISVILEVIGWDEVEKSLELVRRVERESRSD